METTQKENRQNVLKLDQIFIRIQITGMAIFLSGPVAMILADMYGLKYIIPQLSVLIFYIAVIVFCIGQIGRQELKERNTGGE